MALFKKKNKEETIIGQNGVPNTSTQSENSGKVKTTLIFSPDWELSNQEKYVYMYKHQQLPLLDENQFSIKGIKLLPYDGGFVIVALLRNTLPRAIRFDSIDLILLDEEGKTVAKKQFEMDSLGDFPPFSCMPWRFLFTDEDKLSETIPAEGWSIAFHLAQSSSKRAHLLDLDENWDQQLSPVQKDQLEQLVAGLPAISADDVNFMGLEANFTETEDLAVTVLIRNGRLQSLDLEQILLTVEDAAGDIVCQGNFTLDNFTVKPNSTRPWTFLFPNEIVMKSNPDLSMWKIYSPSQQEKVES